MMKNCPKCPSLMENYRYACQSLACSRAGIPVEESLAETDAAEQKGPRPDPGCPECGEVMTLHICPDCGFEVEAEEMRRGFMSVSLIGNAGSGKSNYLAVLVDQLRGEMCKVYDCTLYPTGGDRTMNYYEREYRRPLYEQGVCVTATQQEDLNPLTYTLLFEGQGGRPGRGVGLAFYDSCGEKLETQQEMAAMSRRLLGSGGILLLLDPSQLPAIREARKAKKLPVLPSDAQALLLRTIHIIRAGLASGEVEKKIDIPIAVCLTKLDTLYPHLDPASFVGAPSRNLRKPMLNKADISSCNLEVMALLESWGGGEFVRHVRGQFSNYCFFGLSSLGCEPGSKNEVDRISPHRVLDPMLWLLWQSKILQAG
ncbi:MAG: hypothetical protein FWE19_02720 [Oscillospiraceae bacterium]|nr:hypothetical protein [Oscillospiraceae bacterium]